MPETSITKRKLDELDNEEQHSNEIAKRLDVSSKESDSSCPSNDQCEPSDHSKQQPDESNQTDEMLLPQTQPAQQTDKIVSGEEDVKQEFGKKFRPKKFAIIISYSGVGYYGLQRNNPFRTVEEEILKVWLKIGLILPEHYERPQLLYFQRAARTDKGVSAAKQILTCKLPRELPDRLDEINQLLPQNIRIFGAKTTTKFFDSRTYCDARTYSYMLPTFALASPDQTISTFYRCKAELIDQFNDVLQMYKGTHNFHNFTSGKKATDPSAMRFMIEISAGQPFMMEEMEFSIVRIKGQSFMLHQIRKMIGLAIAVMRGNATKQTIEKAFEEERIDIPIAPGLGLMLEEVHYDRYNLRYGGDGMHEPITWPELNDQIEEFKRKEILPNVYHGEKKEFSMMKWLQTLPIHTYTTYGQDRDSEAQKQRVEEAQQRTEKIIEQELELQKTTTNGQSSSLSDANEESQTESEPIKEEEKEASEKSPLNEGVGDNAYKLAYIRAGLLKKKIKTDDNPEVNEEEKELEENTKETTSL